MTNWSTFRGVRSPDDTVRLMLAASIPLVAFVLQWFFWSTIQPYVWFLFYPAVFFSSWIGGKWAGLSATFFSTVAVWWFFMPPRYSFALERPAFALTMGIFAGMGVLFSFTHERLRRANQQASEALTAVTAAREQLEELVSERSVELSRTADALRDSELDFRTLAEVIPQMVWITRPDGWNIYFNQQWVHYTGMTLEESYGHGWSIPFHPDDRQRAWDAWQQATTTESAYELECRLRRTDGAYRWWLIRGVPLRDTGGTILKWFGTCTDIEELKRTEENLVASRAMLDAALSSMTDAVFISDTEGRFIKFNDAFATFHKFRNKEECAKTLAEYPGILDVFRATGEPAPLDQWAVPRALRGEVATGDEYTLRRKDTGETWVGSYSLAPIRNKDGVIVGSVVTGRDITERKQAEEAIRTFNAELEGRVRERTAQLEALNKELEAFSYSVSHDLKAPLRGIDGYSRLLETEYQDRLDDEGRLFLRNIRAGAARMHQLIDDLLSYSRMERRSLLSVNVDLPALVQAVAAGLATELELAGVQLRREVSPLVVRADRDGLAIVLRNLLENALKFSRAAQSPTVEIGARPEGSTVILWVRDNGIGFDMKFHDRIFEIFQRLQRAEEYPGTGIGLALVRKAMQRMGGRVWAESAPGQGATFYLEIPHGD